MKEKIRATILAAIAIAALAVSLASLEQSIRAKDAESRSEHVAEEMREDNRKLAGELKHLKLLRLAALIGNSVDLCGKDDFEKAICIRDYLHRRVPTKYSKECFDFMEIDYAFSKAMRDENSGHMCGGLAILYAAALESQGIPARYVGIFSADKVPYSSHATVEFWHNGKWYASDPTTNLMFTRNGAFLSYAEVYGLVRDGKAFGATSNGYGFLPERTFDDYPTSLAGFMKYMVIHPSIVASGKEAPRRAGAIQTAGFLDGPTPPPRHPPGKVTRSPMQLFPADWDGAITFENGERRDVRNRGGIYEYLQDGPLR